MPMEGDEYFEMTQAQALSRDIEQLRQALHARNNGRNTKCFPLVSFGGKDADLAAEGCTGIRAIEDTTETEEGWLLYVEIGGHKTFCDPTDAVEREMDADEKSSWSDTAREYVLDACLRHNGIYNCEWTGDEWVASYDDVLKVPFHFAMNIDELAEAIIAQVREALHPFEQAMAAGDHALDRLYKEMEGQTLDDAEDEEE